MCFLTSYVACNLIKKNQNVVEVKQSRAVHVGLLTTFLLVVVEAPVPQEIREKSPTQVSEGDEDSEKAGAPEQAWEALEACGEKLSKEADDGFEYTDPEPPEPGRHSVSGLDPSSSGPVDQFRAAE